MKTIDTDRYSAKLREAAIDTSTGRLLITNFRGTSQESDLTIPPNCKGYGRVRHFKRQTSSGWPPNPLPIDPACKALGLPRTDILQAQAFQNAACNWRCWYCFVPFDLLSANSSKAGWLTGDELIDLFCAEQDRPTVIDLTGGQPDLTPEWIPWMMDALTRRGISETTYLWSDDNLSNDYFWQFLSGQQIERVTGYRNYGKVCCFKGFDAESFAFNTLALPELFDRQFALMGKLLTIGIDLYAYTTFTSPNRDLIPQKMRHFVDRLQSLDEHLPLRTVPLEIQLFTPVHSRMRDAQRAAMDNQRAAIEAWTAEIDERFEVAARELSISEVRLG